MQMSIEDRSTDFGSTTATIYIEPGQSSFSWTRRVQTFDYPTSWVIILYPVVPRYYDPRLGSPPRSIRINEWGGITIDVSAKPILRNQEIACNLVAGQGNARQGNYGIPELWTEGTAKYDVYYYEDGDQKFIYRGGCGPKVYYTKKISGPNAGWCTPAYFTQQGMPPPSSSLDPGELVYDSKQLCLASGGTLPPGAT
jgi:hypothetical protein